MNKTLFKKVKDLCKDTGLSEKYLTAITEKWVAALRMILLMKRKSKSSKPNSGCGKRKSRRSYQVG